MKHHLERALGPSRIPARAALSISVPACLFAFASGEGFYRPLFLVERQLVPYAVKIGASAAPEDVEHALTEVDANLIPILNGHSVLGTLGVGYYHESFTQTEISRGTPERLTGAYGSLFATGEFSRRWYWLTYNLYGSFGNSLADAWNDQDRLVSMSGAGYKLSPRLSVGAMLIYDSNFGETVVIPVPMVNFSSGRFIASLAPPGQLELRYDWTGRLQALALAKYTEFSFYIPAEKDVMTWSAFELQLAMELKVLKWTYLQPYVGALAGDEIAWKGGAHAGAGFSESAKAGLNLLLVVD